MTNDFAADAFTRDAGAAGLTLVLDLARRGICFSRSDVVVQAGSWASAFTMAARPRGRYRADRISLAGDAAYTGGQRLNSCAQDELQSLHAHLARALVSSDTKEASHA